MSEVLQSFKKIYENALSRYTAGCFATGDIIKFDDSILSDTSIGSLPPDLKNKLEVMVQTSKKGESVIAVQTVNLDPLASDNYAPSTITIAYSLGGGRFYDPITLPGTLASHFLRVVDSTNLVDMVPKGCYHEYGYAPIQELDLEELERKRTQGRADSTII